MSRKPVGVINHAGYTHLGHIEQVLKAEGIAWEMLFRETLCSAPPKVDDYTMIISLGSWSSVDLANPAIEAEASLLQRAAELAIPTVGVCFGAQIMAAVRGMKIFRLRKPCIGLFEALPFGQQFFFNEKGFFAPLGVEVLAGSKEQCVAFRDGTALALQFHIDATSETVGMWTADPVGRSKLHACGIDRDLLLEETRRHSANVLTSVRRLLVDQLSRCR